MAMNLRLGDADSAALRDPAVAEGRSMQDVAQTAVREYVNAHSLGRLVDRAMDDVLARYSGALRRLGELRSAI